jgi:hypothetical protein
MIRQEIAELSQKMSLFPVLFYANMAEMSMAARQRLIFIKTIAARRRRGGNSTAPWRQRCGGG